MKTVVGLFDRSSDAYRAVDEIWLVGVGNDAISVVGPKETGTTTSAAGTTTDRGSYAGEGAGIGAGTGAVVGGAAGFLASLGLLAIPGIGPLLAAGPIVAMLAGAGVGAATGGIIGSLVGLGIPEAEAEEYEEGVRRGATLVTVTAPEDKVDQVVELMDRNGAVDVDKRAGEWRSTGWTSRYEGRQRGTRTGASSVGGREAERGEGAGYETTGRPGTRGGVRVYGRSGA